MTLPLAADSTIEPTPSPHARGPWAAAARHQSVVVPVVALLLALLIGAVLIRVQGVNPLSAYHSLARSAFGSQEGWLRTLQKTTPLILTGLAVTIPLRVGLFNIGAQGQLIMAALTAAWIGRISGSLGHVSAVVTILAAMAVGALWASTAAALKVARGVHEVIGTIMLNAIADQVINYLVSGPLRGAGVLPKTDPVSAAAELPNWGPVPLGAVIALGAVGAVAWMFRSTTTGFAFDTIGKNRHAARYAGIGLGRMIMLAMAMAGALAGLAGALEVLGVTKNYEGNYGGTMGFDGITIALLARLNPVGVIPAALVVGALRSAGTQIQFDTGLPPEIVDLLLAIILLLVSLPLIAKVLFGRRAQQGAAIAASWGS